jgi:hypothetical protein
VIMQLGLREQLLALESKYGDSRLAPSEITDLVRKCIKDSNVRVTTKRNGKVDLGYIVPSGAYDSEDDADHEPCVHLDLVYHPDQQHLQLKQVGWDRVSFEICEVIGHEYVHRDQHRKRIRSTSYAGTLAEDAHQRQEQQYYGESNEIEAYGYSIAAELACFYNSDATAAPQTHTYQLYSRLFAHDQSVIMKLEQYISKYLNKLEAAQNVKTNTQPRNRTGFVRRTRAR